MHSRISSPDGGRSFGSAMCAFLSAPAGLGRAPARAGRACPRRRPATCTLSRPPPSATQSGESAPAVPLEDRDVPTAHKGLHETLYGDDSASVHGAGTASAEARARFSDTGETVFELAAFLARIGSEKVAGVYKVLSSSNKPVYVGISRNIALSLQAHVDKHGGETVAKVQVRTFRFPRRADMEAARDAWIDEAGEIPEGNADAAWGEVRADARAKAMTDAERTAFEENKFKLRKAMADPTLIAERDAAGGVDDLRHAVEDDDWSAEINRQSAAVAPPPAAEVAVSTTEVPASAASEGPATHIVSPFAADGNAPAVAETVAEELELTTANVDTVLDSVRPYLLADGGNVSVLSVGETGDVVLQLEGACGTCPSATMTMQMGIERALKKAFGDRLGDVSAVSDSAAANAPLSPELVDAVLDKEVRPAILGLGGTVDVVSADGGSVVLRYAGPDKLAYGIELILREKVPMVQSVVFQS